MALQLPKSGDVLSYVSTPRRLCVLIEATVPPSQNSQRWLQREVRGWQQIQNPSAGGRHSKTACCPPWRTRKVLPSTGVWVRSWGTSRSRPRGQEEGCPYYQHFWLPAAVGGRQTEEGMSQWPPAWCRSLGSIRYQRGACQGIAQERHPGVGTASSYQAHSDSLRGRSGRLSVVF